MVQWVGVLAAKPRDLCSVPRVQWWYKTDCFN